MRAHQFGSLAYPPCRWPVKPAEYRSFRVSLFGPDWMKNIDRLVMNFERALKSL